MKHSLTFLGTGASLGVPVVGCSCKTCKSPLLQNKRLRSSCLIKWKEKRFLIDAGPDFRAQMLQHNIHHLDGVLFTHAHFDHIGGFDDLKVLANKNQKPLACLVSNATYEELKVRCGYLLNAPVQHYFTFQTLLDDYDKTEFEGMPLRYVTYKQMGMQVNGFIFGSTAYISDIKEFSDEIYEMLKGVDTLILSTVRKQAKAALVPTTHLTVEEAIAFAHRTKAKNTIFTHLGHDLEYEEVQNELPDGFMLAFDGLTIEIKV